VWHVEFLTIFPEIFRSFLDTSLVGKAVKRGLFSPVLTNIRDFSAPPHNKVDDSPYGGGAGMVMMVEPLVRAIEAAKTRRPDAHVVLLSPAGARLTQPKVAELSKRDALILVCGRYEGIDQRAIDLAVDEEISIGDFVVMGGEVPAMLLIEAAIRLRPDVIHNSSSVEHESFSESLGGGELVESPQYTRPEEFRGLKVPEILLSGNHKLISDWRLEQARLRTRALQRAAKSDSSKGAKDNDA
jgi:tRNA (guanine37-N1)-methyltransferase